MSKGTTLRNVRVSDALWRQAQAKAAQDDTTVSDVVRAALSEYIERVDA